MGRDTGQSVGVQSISRPSLYSISAPGLLHTEVGTTEVALDLEEAGLRAPELLVSSFVSTDEFQAEPGKRPKSQQARTRGR